MQRKKVNGEIMAGNDKSLIDELNDLEDANQKVFDEKVIAVLTAFLGVVFTFRSQLEIKSWTCLQKFFCAGMVIWITITLGMVVFSYYYGAVSARKYSKQECGVLPKDNAFDPSVAMKTMECLNAINCFNFISCLVLICINILLIIF